jgi:hypothetical protein
LKTPHSTILKKGTEADKAKVAVATNWNLAIRPNIQPGRQMATKLLYLYIQHQHADKLIRNNLQQENNAFGNAFHIVINQKLHVQICAPIIYVPTEFTAIILN